MPPRKPLQTPLRRLTLRSLSLASCALPGQRLLCYTEKPSANPVIQGRKGCSLGCTVTGLVRIAFSTRPRVFTSTPTRPKPTHTSRLPAFLWPFYLASLNRRFIRTGFGPVEPWPTSTCLLTSLSLLVATPCCPWTHYSLHH
jgi:hypothetical protein